MEIDAGDYKVWLDRTTSTVYLKGFLRLNGLQEYQPIMDLLLEAVSASSALRVNLQELEFLNSSGISMLSMFIVKVRQAGNIHLTFHGSNQILWQTKSLRNLQRLMPALTLIFSPTEDAKPA